MPRIDASARVAEGARLADDAEVGPFCVVGPDVELCPGARLISHVNVVGHTTVGERTAVYPFASVGTPPQSVHYRGEPTRLTIGADCMIREGVTINIGTQQGRGVTQVGARCMLMAYSHVGHDCIVGNDVILANSVALGGHCVIGDHVFIGGLTAVHQYTRIGAQAMISGASGVKDDVIPFGVAQGLPAVLRGVNMVGMRRRKLSPDSIRAIKTTYRLLFLGDGKREDRIAVAETQVGADPAAAEILAFVRGRGSRPLCLPRAGAQADDD